MSYAKPAAGKATPDHVRRPRIGPACVDTDKVSPPFRRGENAGPHVGDVGNDVPAKHAAYDKARREGRR